MEESIEVEQVYCKKDDSNLLAEIVKIDEKEPNDLKITIIDPIAPKNSFRYKRKFYWQKESFLKQWKHTPYYNTPLYKVLNVQEG